MNNGNCTRHRKPDAHRRGTPKILLLRVAVLTPIAPAAIPTAPKIIEPQKNGNLILPVGDAQLANGATAGTITIPGASGVPTAKPCIEFQPNEPAATATWNTAIESNVYNVTIYYRATDPSARVALSVNGEKKLEVFLIKTIPAIERDSYSLGPLAIDSARAATLQLKRTDLHGSEALAITDVALEPIGGALASLKPGPSTRPKEERGKKKGGHPSLRRRKGDIQAYRIIPPEAGVSPLASEHHTFLRYRSP